MTARSAAREARKRLTRAVQHVIEPTLAVQTAHMARMVFQGARRIQLPRMAAALAYRTIFGIIPMLVVSLVVLKSFSTTQEMTQKVRDILDFAGISRIAVEPPPDESAFFEPVAPAPTHTPAPPAAETPLDLGAPIAGKAARLEEWIAGLVMRVNSLKYEGIGLVAAATLIYAALSMLVEIEKAFNQIYMAPTGRSWPRRVAQYWTLLTLGAAGLAVTFGLPAWAGSLVAKASEVTNSGALRQVLPLIATFVATVAISSIVMLIVYTTVPNTRVQIMPALAGAIFAGVAWEIGKWGFGAYLTLSQGQARLYGLVALVPLFLLWVYVTWMIVLLGLQIAHTVQTYRHAKVEGLSHSVLATLGLAEPVDMPRNPLVDPAAILVVALAVAERFAKGRTAEVSDAAGATGVDERVVAEMLERLAGAGFLHRVETGDRGAYSLARPPEAIGAADVLRLAERLTLIDRARTPKLLEELRGAAMQSVAGQSLADLMKTRALEPTVHTPVLA